MIATQKVNKIVISQCRGTMHRAHRRN